MIDGEWGPYSQEGMNATREIAAQIRQFLFDAETEAEMNARAVVLMGDITTATCERRLDMRMRRHKEARESR